MGKRNEYHLSGIKLVVLGLVLMAINLFAIYMVRVARVWTLAEFASIFVMFLSWAAVFLGIVNISKYAKEYRAVKIVSILMMVLTVMEAIFAFFNLKGGMGVQTFIEFKVMLCAYTVNVGMLYTYQKILKGTGILVKNYRSTNMTKRCNSVWIPSAIVIAIIWAALPIATMFSNKVAYITTGALGTVAFLLLLNMCRLIIAGVREVSKGSKNEKKV